MPTDVAVDNDVLHKLACYQVLSEASETLSRSDGGIGVLGAARFVVGKLLARADAGSGQLVAFKEFLEFVEILEPTEDEVALAVELEEEALRGGLDIDPGESQLLAIARSRQFRFVATGDKRAIAGVEAASSSIRWLAALRQHIVCLEQVMMALTESVETAELRPKVCSAGSIDKAVRACFGCSGGNATSADICQALSSYVEHLRQVAPTMLAPGPLTSL